MFRHTAIIPVILLVVASVILSACTGPVTVPLETGSVQVTSIPAGAEVYLDSEYRGTTPTTIPAVPAGSHIVEARLAGYEHWSSPVSVTAGSTAMIPAKLAMIQPTLPVTFATTSSPRTTTGVPQIHVDGYWMYPQGVAIQVNPVSLFVHTEAFNVGTTNAREVTVAANFYYQGHMVCWNTIYLGTLNAGGHIARDSLVSCTLPTPINSQELTVLFENLVVTP